MVWPSPAGQGSRVNAKAELQITADLFASTWWGLSFYPSQESALRSVWRPVITSLCTREWWKDYLQQHISSTSCTPHCPHKQTNNQPIVQLQKTVELVIVQNNMDNTQRQQLRCDFHLKYNGNVNARQIYFVYGWNCICRLSLKCFKKFKIKITRHLFLNRAAQQIFDKSRYEANCTKQTGEWKMRFLPSRRTRQSHTLAVTQYGENSDRARVTPVIHRDLLFVWWHPINI